MKRLLFIILLSGIFCSTAAQELTHVQLQSFTSKKEYKNLKITSYVAVDGQTYSIGDELTVGNKTHPRFYTTLLKGGLSQYNVGDKFTISKFAIHPGKGELLMTVWSKNGLCSSLDQALVFGELLSMSSPSGAIVPGPENTATTEVLSANELSYKTLGDCAGGNYTSYTASDGSKFIVNESYVVLSHTFENNYTFITANPLFAGRKGAVTSIYVKPKGKKKVVEMKLTFDEYNTFKVTSVEDALSNGEMCLYVNNTAF